MMHLVDTTLFYSPTSGGVRRYLTAKHAWLGRNTNWKHTIVVPGEEDVLRPGDVTTIGGHLVPGAFNYRLPLNPSHWSRVLDALEPDVIEAGDAFHPAWCAWRVAQSRGIPAVAFFHSNLPRIFGRRFGHASERAVGQYVRWLYDRFDLVFAPSRAMCDYLASIGVQRTALQPLGVDAENFSPERRRLDLREKLGLAPDTRLLVYAGRFSREKNVPVLLQAFARLGRPYHLLLIGGDRSERPSPQVTLIPYRRDAQELAEWMASCDALVHAGTRETFGLVVLEAMACGIPVVGARAGAVPELVSDDVGLLAEPNDATSMAAAIAALYDRDIAALGRSARQRILDRYTWTQALSIQMLAYQRAIAAHGRTVAHAPAVEVPN